MISNIASYLALTALVLVAAIGATRIVVAEREAGWGTPDPAPRSPRVRAIDGYLLGVSGVLVAALSVFFVAGLQQ